MKKWLLLAGAIISEVAGSLALQAGQDHPAWYILVAIGYVGAFTLLALVLREGMALGVAYGIWGAMGVALTAVLAALLFGQPLTGVMILGLALIIGGVLTVELGSQAAQRKRGEHLMVWLFLILAIVLEVGAALSLRLATGGRKLFYIAVVVGYLGAFFFLTQVLALGLGIGVAYGIWAASGVALTAVASKFLFKEPFTWVMALGIALIIGGVLLVELGAAH